MALSGTQNGLQSGKGSNFRSLGAPNNFKPGTLLNKGNWWSSVSSTMPSIASDYEETDLACTMTAIGNLSISTSTLKTTFDREGHLMEDIL